MLVPLSRGLDALRHVRPGAMVAWVRGSIRFVAAHTGLPALVVAAVLVVVGYRLLRRSARFLVEVALVALLLVVATELGWIRW